MRIALFAWESFDSVFVECGPKKHTPRSADQRLDCPHGVGGDAQVTAGQVLRRVVGVGGAGERQHSDRLRKAKHDLSRRGLLARGEPDDQRIAKLSIPLPPEFGKITIASETNNRGRRAHMTLYEASRDVLRSHALNPLLAKWLTCSSLTPAPVVKK